MTQYVQFLSLSDIDPLHNVLMCHFSIQNEKLLSEEVYTQKQFVAAAAIISLCNNHYIITSVFHRLNSKFGLEAINNHGTSCFRVHELTGLQYYLYN